MGTTFDPLVRLDDVFLSVVRSETPHLRWNIFLSDETPDLGVLFTNGLPVFQWKANDPGWSLVDRIGQPSQNHNQNNSACYGPKKTCNKLV